jgi:hypothetical protein
MGNKVMLNKYNSMTVKCPIAVADTDVVGGDGYCSCSHEDCEICLGYIPFIERYQSSAEVKELVNYLRSKLVIYDMDGVLIDLNGTICTELNIDVTKITHYDYDKNTKLSADEREKILQGYRDVEFFKLAKLRSGAYEIPKIQAKHNCRVGIHSLSYTQAIADYKQEMLLRELGLESYQLMLPVGEDKDTLPSIAILVEDSLVNLINSTAQFNILVRQGNNDIATNGYNLSDFRNLYIAENLDEANEAVDHILTNWDTLISERSKL